jgi:RNA polymerase sigma factor (sigma-70 family)
LSDFAGGGCLLGEMHEGSDAQLLREYAGHGDEAAFREIVARHTDLVYSSALRQVGSPDLAQDVAQSVFTDLARKAPELAASSKEHASLLGWLYRSTRYAALNQLRDDRRRQARERQIMQDFPTAIESEPEWDHVRPVLDEAMAELGEDDREALLLRFFRNQDFRTVGRALGVSDDTAQKRVSRALDRLRIAFTRRGVTTSAGALAAVLPAHAVTLAPPGMAAALSSAALAGPTIAVTATITATKAIVMTTLQKALITGTLVAAIGAGVYEARQALRLREEVQTLQQQQAPLTQQIQQLQQERDDALKRLAAAAAKPAPRLPAPPVQVTAPPATPPEELRSTNLYSRIKDGVQLTAKQVEPYLKAHGRNAASLLAAYRTTDDPALLAEAMQKYPNDPLVAMEAAYSKGASPETQRQWLEVFKRTAQDNALPNYLLARSYFQAGQTDLAVQELVAASGKPLTQDYFADRMSDDEEAYLAAGYSAAEAKAVGLEQLVLMPNRSDLKQLAYDMVELAKSYQRAGDDASAQRVLQMAAQLGRRGQNPAPGQITVDKFLGFAMETLALNTMNPSSSYGDGGQTVRDRLNEIAQQKAALKALVERADVFRETMSDQDWIALSDRLKIFGEEAALRWVLSKYGRN